MSFLRLVPPPKEPPQICTEKQPRSVAPADQHSGHNASLFIRDKSAKTIYTIRDYRILNFKRLFKYLKSQLSFYSNMKSHRITIKI